MIGNGTNGERMCRVEVADGDWVRESGSVAEVATRLCRNGSHRDVLSMRILAAGMFLKAVVHRW